MEKELTTVNDDIDIEMSDMMPVLMIAMMAMMVSFMTTVVTPLSQQLQAQAYTALTDSRVLIATPQLQYVNLLSGPPYKPWITASFHNDGWTQLGVDYDWSVFIGINNPDELHELRSGEDYVVNMTGSDRRIEFIFYKANPGEKASIRVVGKY